MSKDEVARYLQIFADALCQKVQRAKGRTMVAAIEDCPGGSGLHLVVQTFNQENYILEAHVWSEGIPFIPELYQGIFETICKEIIEDCPAPEAEEVILVRIDVGFIGQGGAPQLNKVENPKKNSGHKYIH